MSEVTNDHKVAEIRRELGYRRRVYGRMAEEHPEKKAGLDRRVAVMEAILADYEAIGARERPALL